MERRGSRRSRSPRRIPTSRTGSSAITRKRKAPATGRSEEHKMTAWDDWLRKLSADGKGGLGLRGQPQMRAIRSEEHTSELQSLMRISYAVFCLKKKKKRKNQ